MTKSLNQLESENADFLAAKADAERDIAELRDRRARTLLTGDVDAIEELDAQIRRHSIEVEVADARARELTGPIYVARAEAKRWVGVDMPDSDELAKLYTIVVSAYPDLSLAREMKRTDFGSRDFMDEFRRAFFGVGRFGRLAEPSSERYYHSVVDDVNQLLEARRHKEVEGDAIMVACLAWGDVTHRRADRSLGQLTEVGLARIGQGVAAKPMWRKILSGEASLVPSLPPRNVRASSSTYPEPRVRIRYGDGREVDPAAPLGVR
jgi:hypothetical protein